MDMVNEWSEMHLRMKNKKRDEIHEERERIKWKGIFWVKMEKKWEKVEGISYGGFRERKWRQKERDPSLKMNSEGDE